MIKFIGMFGPKWIPFKIRYWVCIKRLMKNVDFWIDQPSPFMELMRNIKKGPVKGKPEWTRRDGGGDEKRR